jgi:hypothetical protein
MSSDQALALAESASITKVGFGTTESIIQHETAATAVAARVTAEIQARTIVALQRPRNLDMVRQRLLAECRRPEFAKSARYAIPRGKDRETGRPKFIEGLSIRFAEAAQRCMGNLDTASSIIYDDSRKMILHVTCTDLESNTTYSTEVVVPKTVEKSWLKKGQQPLGQRVNSNGEVVYLVEGTEAEIAQQAAAMRSKEIRTLILRHLPGDIKEEAERLCIRTAADEDSRDPSAARRVLFDAFFEIGVPADQLRQYVGHGNSALAPSELEELRAVYAAIRDGEITWTEALANKTGVAAAQEDATTAAKHAKVQATLERAKAKQAAAAARKQSAPKPPPPPAEQPSEPDPDNDGR